MPPTSRDDARIERRLIATLTEACETAKTEIPGFAWLTHTVDYRAFPQSLRVIWIFDSRASQEHALSTGADNRMRELTAAALNDAGVHVPTWPAASVSTPKKNAASGMAATGACAWPRYTRPTRLRAIDDPLLRAHSRRHPRRHPDRSSCKLEVSSIRSNGLLSAKS